MERVNLITLKRGLNTIDVVHEDLGLESSKKPFAFLPAGTQIKSVLFDVKEKFRSTGSSNVHNPESNIQYKCMIGTEEDTQEFLTYSYEPATIFGKSNANTGSYFNSPTVKNYDTKLILETWVTSKIWTVGDDLATARRNLAGAGTQTAGLSFGGFTGSYVGTTEEYSSATWSSGGSLSTSRYGLGGCGTQTAGLSFGGYTGSFVATTEEYNGASWSGGGSLNVAGYFLAGCGTQSAGLSFGGIDSGVYSDTTEEYNGTSWSLGNDMNYEYGMMGGCGTQTSALSCGGYDVSSNYLTVSEEYNGSTWAITNNLNFQRRLTSCFGIQNDAICSAGESEISALSSTEEYNGSTWSMGNNLNYEVRNLASSSTQPGMTFGGWDGNEYIKRTELYSSVNPNEISLSGKMNITLLVT